ncbi:translation initiation factor IF-2-like isoform X1 [Canis lupus familiaris]|uniref:translation initiation factor IF-2-like isoform X1 n=1 Tax=Canis lupus familiaris TaxID=9615 RepID=UPI0006B3D92C|nr:translation initiation factor IF-2-like isoform X1 [Canis lupus familiaris]XP_038310360.1 translation initiation factor IF-2-like isoform X1 [Canis lupus familiaris]
MTAQLPSQLTALFATGRVTRAAAGVRGAGPGRGHPGRAPAGSAHGARGRARWLPGSGTARPAPPRPARPRAASGVRGAAAAVAGSRRGTRDGGSRGAPERGLLPAPHPRAGHRVRPRSPSRAPASLSTPLLAPAAPPAHAPTLHLLHRPGSFPPSLFLPTLPSILGIARASPSVPPHFHLPEQRPSDPPWAALGRLAPGGPLPLPGPRSRDAACAAGSAHLLTQAKTPVEACPAGSHSCPLSTGTTVGPPRTDPKTGKDLDGPLHRPAYMLLPGATYSCTPAPQGQLPSDRHSICNLASSLPGRRNWTQFPGFGHARLWGADTPTTITGTVLLTDG